MDQQNGYQQNGYQQNPYNQGGYNQPGYNQMDHGSYDTDPYQPPANLGYPSDYPQYDVPQNAYQQSGYPNYGQYPVQPGPGLAIASLACGASGAGFGLLGMLFCCYGWFLSLMGLAGGIVAVVLSMKSTRRGSRGEGMAKAGLILGYVAIGTFALGMIFEVIFGLILGFSLFN